MIYTKNNRYELHLGKMQEVLQTLQIESIDAVITDPPYELGFMGKSWDSSGVAFQRETWEHCLRVLKPGGYLLAFGGTRTYHRIACAIEDAGFEIRDCILWIYSSGFPKSMNIGLAVDKKLGIESEDTGVMSPNARPNCTKDNTLYESGTVGKSFTIKKATNEWAGWGSTLKPAYEPIIVARKPFSGSLVDNVLEYGVGGLNIDECRVPLNLGEVKTGGFGQAKTGYQKGIGNSGDTDYKCEWVEDTNGRFPANLTHDGSEEVLRCFPYTKSTGGSMTMPDFQDVGAKNAQLGGLNKIGCTGVSNASRKEYDYVAPIDEGSAARCFYCAKASRRDREEGLEDFQSEKVNDGRQTPVDNPLQRGETPRKNTHPTVKNTTLMQYLIRLVCPKGAVILDPFNGSGSTGKAAMYENNDRNANYYYIGVEMTAEYLPISKARIDYAIRDKEKVEFDSTTVEKGSDKNNKEKQHKIDLW